MTKSHHRLFLSYGRRDPAELANRLRIDLKNRGYEVWQDSRELRAGKEWKEQIADGLRSTQVVIALLSPHTVRRATDPNSPDNELAKYMLEIQAVVCGPCRLCAADSQRLQRHSNLFLEVGVRLAYALDHRLNFATKAGQRGRFLAAD